MAAGHDNYPAVHVSVGSRVGVGTVPWRSNRNYPENGKDHRRGASWQSYKSFFSAINISNVEMKQVATTTLAAQFRKHSKPWRHLNEFKEDCVLYDGRSTSRPDRRGAAPIFDRRADGECPNTRQ